MMVCVNKLIVVTLSQDVRERESQITVNVKQKKKHFTKLAGASSPEGGEADVGGAGMAPGKLGLHHLQAASNQESSSGSWWQHSHLVDREGRTQ